MQRWIAAGVVTVILILGGGGFAYWQYKQNKPSPIWVPLQTNTEIPDEKREEIASDLKAKLSQPVLLAQVSKDLGLPGLWKLPSDQDAAQEIARRLFVRTGQADTPGGKVPSINVGLDGKASERATTEKVVMRLMQDVWKIVGITPPPGPGF